MIAKIDRKIHMTLKIINVGSVFLVEDHTSIVLVTKAITYSHHQLYPHKRPGIMMTSFVINAKNSIVFGLSQYSL